MTGSDYERDLASLLDDDGYHVMRAPSSGAGTTRELPDLLWASHFTDAVAAELKTTGQNVAYFDGDEVESLVNFARSFVARSWLVARFKGDTTFYCYSIDDARQTDSGRYAVDRDTETVFEVSP